jgi:hypothetical protein
MQARTAPTVETLSALTEGWALARLLAAAIPIPPTTPTITSTMELARFPIISHLPLPF